MLTANRKRLAFSGMALDVCDFFRVSYENMHKSISLEDAALLSFQTTTMFDFRMFRSPPFPNKMEPVCTAFSLPF